MTPPPPRLVLIQSTTWVNYIICNIIKLLSWRMKSHFCLAAIQRIWSSNKNLALYGDPVFVWWMVTCKHFDSSLSPVTCEHKMQFILTVYETQKRSQEHCFHSSLTSTSCRNPANFVTPQPNNLECGSTKISWLLSIARKRRLLLPSLLITVHVIKSLLSNGCEIFVNYTPVKLDAKMKTFWRIHTQI